MKRAAWDPAKGEALCWARPSGASPRAAPTQAQGRKKIKGRRRKDGTRTETLYYACGSYIRKGREACSNIHIPKEAFEQLVMSEIQKQIAEFIDDGGALMLQALVMEESGGGHGEQQEETELQDQLAEKRARLDQLVASITPAIVSIIEPELVGLRKGIDRLEARLERIREARVSAEEARRLVEGLVGDLGRVAEVIASAPFLDQREIVRGLTHEIAIDGSTMRAEIAFYAVLRLEVVSNNEEGPAAGAEGLSLCMAGGGLEPPTSGL